MFEYKRYAGTVEPNDGAFSGRVVGLREVVTIEGQSYAEVEATVRDSIDDYLAFAPNRPTGPTAAKSRSESIRASIAPPQSAPGPRG